MKARLLMLIAFLFLGSLAAQEVKTYDNSKLFTGSDSILVDADSMVSSVRTLYEDKSGNVRISVDVNIVSGSGNSVEVYFVQKIGEFGWAAGPDADNPRNFKRRLLGTITAAGSYTYEISSNDWAADPYLGYYIVVKHADGTTQTTDVGVNALEYEPRR